MSYYELLMSLINTASVFSWVAIHALFHVHWTLFSMASQWLPYSTVNLKLSNILYVLEICHGQHDRWANHHHNKNTIPCMGDKMQTN